HLSYHFSLLMRHTITSILTLSLHDALPIYGPDVDAELEGRGRDKAFDLPALESRLDPLALLAGQRAVVDRDILTDHREAGAEELDRKSTRLNSSHGSISYAVFCLNKKKKEA